MTMSAIFCCSSVSPYRPQTLDHEAKFTAFMTWVDLQATSQVLNDDSSAVDDAPYAVQLVRQINYGPQESVRYFVLVDKSLKFAEVREDTLLKSNFEKVNSYVTMENCYTFGFCVDTLLGTRTSSVEHTISSTKSICTKEIPLMHIIGESTLPDHLETSTCVFGDKRYIHRNRRFH